MNIEQKLELLRDLGIEIVGYDGEIEEKFSVVMNWSQTRDEYIDSLEDCYDLESMGFLANYIDYDALIRDLILGGDLVEFEFEWETRYLDYVRIVDISNGGF